MSPSIKAKAASIRAVVCAKLAPAALLLVAIPADALWVAFALAGALAVTLLDELRVWRLTAPTALVLVAIPADAPWVAFALAK